MPAGREALARALGRARVRPNSVSVAGLGLPWSAGAAFFAVPPSRRAGRAAALLVAAAAIQLRLLCNMLDGMLAVEEGLKTARPAISTTICPIGLADVLILVGAGYSIRDLAGGPALGWAAAVIAAADGLRPRRSAARLGLTQHFIGPMAKQHRMFTLTIATLLAAVESMLGMPARAMRIGLVVILAGIDRDRLAAHRAHRREVEAR